jgi:hypothetical protein
VPGLRPSNLLAAAAAWLALLLLAGCPPHSKTDKPADPVAPPPAAAVLPAHGRLLGYDKLHLGMSSFDIAQVYNAPEGQGKGFKRLIQDFGDVQHHIVTFDAAASQPQRKLVLALLRDELYELVERRDGLTAEQAAAWRGEVVKRYGPPAAESIPGAQWSWGPENGVSLTFTQDNASDKYMSANVVIIFKPYADLAYQYLADWQKAHPDFGKTPPQPPAAPAN